MPTKNRTASSRPPVYTRFTPPLDADERESVRAHLRWLLINMDYFARRGHRELQTASLALQRDLAMLGALQGQPSVPTAQELAAQFHGPDARAVAAELANLHQLLGRVRELLDSVRLKLGDWGMGGDNDGALVSPAAEALSRSEAQQFLLRAMRIMDGMPEAGARPVSVPSSR